MNIMKKKLQLIVPVMLFFFMAMTGYAQTWESEAQLFKVNRVWSVVMANGDNSPSWVTPSLSTFFPNDYDILWYKGQTNEAFTGSGFRMGCINWAAPPVKLPNGTIKTDSIYSAPVFGPLSSDFLPSGKVLARLSSYARYPYTKYTIVNGSTVNLPNWTNVDATKLTGGTYDQLAQVTSLNVIGMKVNRKIMGWSQNLNDNYLIVDVELTNVGVPKKINGKDTLVVDTLRNYYFNMNIGATNIQYSDLRNPTVGSSSVDYPKYSYIWQHYHGGRPTDSPDSLRVFYYYSADDPQTSGDNMGGPVISQNGRLAYSNYNFFTILHASAAPYDTISRIDVNDPLQPKVTYTGTETKIPDPGDADQYGSKNYWAIHGGFSDNNPMPGQYAGAHHMANTDELGVTDFSKSPAGTLTATNTLNNASFGPYTVPPGYALHFVYAVGIAGIGEKTAKEVGEKWARHDGSLLDPPAMPNPNTGWFPSTFAFPTTDQNDQRKDRWLSMGRDSVLATAARAKWNFSHGYKIPQAPPPPDSISITAFGDGVVINWRDPAAEALSNFAGYRIMRRISSIDTTFYSEIYNSGSGDKAALHTYRDTNVIALAETYYYVQSKSIIDITDPNYANADPDSRGKILYSGRTFVPDIISVKPPRYSSDDMNKIRIVPNPYNYNDPLLVKVWGLSDAQNSGGRRQIGFYNLPPVVTIRIYTENGDLVSVLQHNSPVQRSGSDTWNMLNGSGQAIKSGVYIAVFQKPTGEISYQKFVIVR
jgi:hypothetical protein